MPYLRFKIPEMTSASAAVATFATVSGFPGGSVATVASVASVAGASRNSEIETVATAAVGASHHVNYGIWDVADLHEMFEERAAIMEYDAGVSRADAEAAAWSDVFGNRSQSGAGGPSET